MVTSSSRRWRLFVGIFSGFGSIQLFSSEFEVKCLTRDFEMSKKYESVYRNAFSVEFPCIKESRKGTTYAFCCLCRCDFSVAHGGKGDLIKHVQTKKHKENTACVEGSSKLNFLGKCDESESVTRAECLFTSFIIEHNLPFNCADHAGALFRQMFPDSQIAKKYGCARTKTAAIVSEMGINEKNKISEILQNSPFSISTDGSNKGDAKLYPIVVTVYRKETRQVENSILSVPSLEGDATGQNIGNLVLATLKSCNISLSNCLALSADNAPVMLGMKNGVAAVLKREMENIIIMGCPCHLINLAAEKGAACLPVKIDEYLIDIYYYLEKSVKRKEHLKHFQELHNTEIRKILKHVCTRWLSLGRCLNRLLQQWQPLASFFRTEVCGLKVSSPLGSLQTYKIPKLDQSQAVNKGSHSVDDSDKGSGASKSVMSSKRSSESQTSTSKTKKNKQGDISEKNYNLSREERLFMFLSSELNKAFCLFLSNIVPAFETPNVLLQSSEPQIHALRSLLFSMLQNLMSKFVKAAVVKSASSILVVDYHSSDNQKNDIDLVIGTATTKVVATLKQEDKLIFFDSVRKYYSASCDYIVHKFPLKDEVLIHAEVANISTICNASFSSVKFFIERFPVIFADTEQNLDEELDVLQSQFCNFQLESELPQDISAEDRLDVKWSLVGEIKAADGTLKYDKLSRVMLSILTIPHSNAACERVFSQVTKTHTQFRSALSEETLERLLTVKSTKKGNCFEQKFDTSFLKAAKSAMSRKQ